MIFKGLRYTKSRTVVILPPEMWDGSSHNYAMFGWVCASNTPGAVKTTYTFRGNLPDRYRPDAPLPEPAFYDEGKEPHWPVYALPIKKSGHSLTNLMYGADGNSYLYENGHVYVRGRKQRFHT